MKVNLDDVSQDVPGFNHPIQAEGYSLMAKLTMHDAFGQLREDIFFGSVADSSEYLLRVLVLRILIKNGSHCPTDGLSGREGPRYRHQPGYCSPIR